MSIKDLYSSGFVARNQGHFAAIVRVALSDGKIVKEEQLFLEIEFAYPIMLFLLLLLNILLLLLFHNISIFLLYFT